MRIADFVVRDAILPDLHGTNKESVIREMVDSLRAAGNFKSGDPEEVVKAILKRELLGSTGIGRGVAIPHTKHPTVDRLVGTVALSKGGVSFESRASIAARSSRNRRASQCSWVDLLCELATAAP